MSEGLFFCFLTSFFTTAVAISLSYIARKRLDVVAVMTVASVIIAGSLWLFRTDFSYFNQTRRLGELIIVMLLAGAFTTSAAMVGQRAMRSGHHGIVWIISQSAIVLSFLFGTFWMAEPVTPRKLGGMLVVVFSFVLIGVNKSTGTSRESESRRMNWKIWAFLNFFLVGSFQILSALPSYWPAWTDPAQLRPALGNTGMAMSYLVLMLVQRRFPGRRELLLGLGIAVVALPITVTQYMALDALAVVNRVSLAFPLIIGVSMVLFLTYSLFFLKEPTSRGSLIGLATAIAGIVLLSI